MKKFIVLSVFVLGGFYWFFRAPETPDGLGDYEEEEYTEYAESTEEVSKPQVPVETPKKVDTPEQKKEVLAVERPTQREEPTPPPPETSEPTEKDKAEKERGEAMVKAIKNFTPQDLEEVQKYYDRLENRWKSVIKNAIGENNYAEYEIMRQEFQEERKESFVRFHKSMVEEHGEKHVYSPIEYEKQVGKRIQEAYFERFRERFGPEAHRRYQETLQKFNGEAKRNQDPAKGLLKIFF